MARRTPEEREQARRERDARRTRPDASRPGRADAPRAGRADAPDGQGRDAGARFLAGGDEPVTPPRTRSALADRPPISRAARAQRVGRPGRPLLPAHSPRPRRWFRRLMAVLALAAIGAALYAINATFQPLQGTEDETEAVAVRIPPGTDAGQIGALLEAKGVIADQRFFEVNATLTLRRGKLQTGRYVLRRDMTNGAAIDALMQGPEVRVVKTFKVTVPEGLGRRETAPRLGESGIRGSYRRASADPAAVRRARRLGLPRGRRSTEGFLYPATYDLQVGATAATLVDKQLDAFADAFDGIDLRYARRRDLSRYDVIKIASMIERETPLDRERPLVSAVIHNRLAQGTPLGIDATLRYALDNWSQPLKQSELERDFAYNSRLRAGLPPTPIGNPGRDSLHAAARPARVNYLFYVVEPGGCHAFSRTNAEFERDVARYEAARRANGGRAPRTKC